MHLPQKFVPSPAFPGGFSLTRDRINGSDEFPMNAAKKLELVSLGGTGSLIAGLRSHLLFTTDLLANSYPGHCTGPAPRGHDLIGHGALSCCPPALASSAARPYQAVIPSSMTLFASRRYAEGQPCRWHNRRRPRRRQSRQRHHWCLSKPERIDSQIVGIWCPCPESNQDIIQLSEAGEEI